MPNRRFASALASALADLGVAHACISPGSRNTPLIAGFAEEDRIQKWSLIDERTAGFFAMGIAKATGKPVVLACTSGTAAAEYHPAIVEASQSDIPLLVLTADRPEELRDVGAPQTIDQLSLYGTAVRMFADALAPCEDTPPGVAADIAVDIWAHATASPPGPVHLNLPFREPLLEGGAGPRPERIAMPAIEPMDRPSLDEVGSLLRGKNGLIVAGRCNDPDYPTACTKLAAATGYPVIADPLSGLRFGSHPLDHILSHGDLLATAGVLDSLGPEVVLRFGPVPTSKSVWRWMQDHPEVEQILIDEQSRDATRSASLTLEIPAVEAAEAITVASTAPAPPAWLDSWVERDNAIADLLDRIVDGAGFPNEPAVARILTEAIPSDSIVTVGSSMPIRDLDSFARKGSTPIRVFGNRGANGIDGVVSAALGTAAAGANSVVLVGDVSMLHDIGSLRAAALLELPVTIVVVNNNGGGIFHFLPQHDPALLEREAFEKYLATPHGTDFVAVAKAFGIEAHNTADASELASLIGEDTAGPRLIQVDTNREANHSLHQVVSEEVRDLFK